MPKIKYFIYDLDGTLDNTMPGYTQAFIEVLADKGVPEGKLKRLGQEYNNSAGTPLRQQFASVLLSQGISMNIEGCCTRFWELLQDEKPNPFPGALPLITEVHRRQGKQYITTGSKTTRARNRIEEMGLLSYFNLILGQGDGIDKGSQHLSLFKDHSGDVYFEKYGVYLGDGPKDMEYAREFGIVAVGISTTLSGQKLRDAGAQYVIDSLEEFLPLVKRIEER